MGESQNCDWRSCNPCQGSCDMDGGRGDHGTARTRRLCSEQQQCHAFCYMLQPALQFATTGIASCYHLCRVLLHRTTGVMIFATTGFQFATTGNMASFNQQHGEVRWLGDEEKLQPLIQNATPVDEESLNQTIEKAF